MLKNQKYLLLVLVNQLDPALSSSLRSDENMITED